MLCPQSDSEVLPVVEALRRLDPLLDVRWNPKKHVLVPGSYSVLGERIDPVYDGRWEVIRYQSASQLHRERDYAVIVTVSALIDVDGIPCMIDKGPYAPLGEWLVRYMQAADAANVQAFTAIRNKLWAQDDALEHAKDAEGEAKDRDALDRVHFDAVYAGGVGNWHGKGADFSASPLSTTP